MSYPVKLLDKKRVTDAELQAIIESDEFYDDEVFENSASDVEENDFIIESEKVEDTVLASEEDTFEPEEANNVPNYVARDGTTWSKIPYTSRAKRPKHNIQKVKSGLTAYSSNFVSKKETFNLFFNHQIINTIITETNRKAQFFYNKVEVKFSPFIREEIEGFIGLLFIFGALHSSKEPIAMLWSKDPVFCRPIVSAIMSRTRFKQIMCFLRFDNFETRNERRAIDKLAPIRSVFDIFVNNCKKAYNPGKHLCVDEQLLPFRGRAPFRVYMKSKPDKYGIKIWALADCSTAYTVNMQVYLGKEGSTSEKGQGQRVVLDMVNHLPQGHGITTDNFFTSLDLADKLLEKNLSLCGTLRKNKTFIPKELLPASFKMEFSSMFAFMKNKTIVSYVPKKKQSVLLLSTEHNDDKTAGENKNYKPDIILHYNKTKGAVDTSDKLAKEYTTQRKTNRWPMAMFYHLLDIGGINAYKVWMEKYPNWEKNRLDNRRLFLLDLGKELGKGNVIHRYKTCKSLNSHVKKNMEVVLPELLDPEAEAPPTTIQATGRCYICERKKDRKSKNRCIKCTKCVCKEHSKFQHICNNCN